SRPLRRRMMAAMAQQDCGQCGYTCETYANEIVQHAEERLNLCVPGGKDTARMLKKLIEEMGGRGNEPDEEQGKAARASPTGGRPRRTPGRRRDSSPRARSSASTRARHRSRHASCRQRS